MASSQHLAYLHASLSLTPPIRPDGRTPTQFRPLVAETGILPGTNGSARICFADGTEAIVGVKAEVERTAQRPGEDSVYLEEGGAMEDDDEEGGETREDKRKGEASWVEMTVEIPGLRDDDSGTAFLAAMLSEALLADGEFVKRLWINRRFHWKLPFFDDDWAAAPYLSRAPTTSSKSTTPSTPSTTLNSTSARPPITLLVMAVGNNIIFDPSKEELAVADVALAVSVTGSSSTSQTDAATESAEAGRNLRLLSIRTIDPPSRLTPPGVPNATNAAYGAANGANGGAQKMLEARTAETEAVEGVWKAQGWCEEDGFGGAGAEGVGEGGCG
ncbi:Exosome complex component rrp42 [Collariella sp. IMI 366227]|nr:Exosome complex component rrp42 [Collariella sp. IMI 366227]